MRQEHRTKFSNLANVYGPLLGGKDLIRVLGFKTTAAFRRAERLGYLGVKTFNIKGRRGKFAYTEEVDEWLRTLNE